MKKLLIANRNEIARRILRTAKQKNYQVGVVATHSELNSLVCSEADHIIPVNNYLNIEEIVLAAKQWNANLLHPGYGFLSENPTFAEQITAVGIGFIGPSSQTLKLFGCKEAAKKLAAECKIPTVNSIFSEELSMASLNSIESLLQSKNVLPPYLVKANQGAGGRGLRVANSIAELMGAIERAKSEAKALFANSTVFIESYLPEIKHIEVQIFGDGHGGGVVLGERECSIQRRQQKIIEECPAPSLTPEERIEITTYARLIMQKSCYLGAGTVEFIQVIKTREFFFIEVNPRLQVEHTVTEEAFGIDLVAAQLELAEGKWPSSLPKPDKSSLLAPTFHAIEARVLAEDPRCNFLPTPGLIKRYIEPSIPFVRIDSGVCENSFISSDYDSLIAKVIARGSNRIEARRRLEHALEEYVIHGCKSNLPFLCSIVRHPDYIANKVYTTWLEQYKNELIASLLPKKLEDFFTGIVFRDRLTQHLSGCNVIQSNSIAQRFAKLSNKYFNTGCDNSLGFFEINKFREQHLLLSGTGIQEILSSCDTQSWHVSQKIKNICAKTKSGQNENALRLIATKIDVSYMDLSIYGETLHLECPVTMEISTPKAGEQELLAPMTGKILEICVKEGQVLNEGDTMFVMESMKMQIEVKVKYKGQVNEIKVKQEQLVSDSEILAIIINH